MPVSRAQLPAASSRLYVPRSHDLLDVVARARRRALAQELQAPEPLAHVGAQAEQQRRVFLPSHCSTLSGAPGIGPGLGMADRDLAAVGEAGLRRRRRLAVDDGHLVAELLEVVGRGHAEQAGAKNDHAHIENP